MGLTTNLWEKKINESSLKPSTWLSAGIITASVWNEYSCVAMVTYQLIDENIKVHKCFTLLIHRSSFFPVWFGDIILEEEYKSFSELASCLICGFSPLCLWTLSLRNVFQLFLTVDCEKLNRYFEFILLWLYHIKSLQGLEEFFSLFKILSWPVQTPRIRISVTDLWSVQFLWREEVKKLIVLKSVCVCLNLLSTQHFLILALQVQLQQRLTWREVRNASISKRKGNTVQFLCWVWNKMQTVIISL